MNSNLLLALVLGASILLICGCSYKDSNVRMIEIHTHVTRNCLCGEK